MRLGLGLTGGGLFKRLLGVTSAVPLVGCSSGAESCLLNLFTILLTFPAESFLLLPVSSGGGKQACVEGFGGISGFDLPSCLRYKGSVGCWDASSTDMVGGGGFLLQCVSLQALTNQRSGFEDTGQCEQVMFT